MNDSNATSLACMAAEQIAAEDRHVREMNCRLQECRDIAALLVCASELRTRLVGHFAVEEQPGGFFDTDSDQSPRHVARLDALRREHGEMLMELDVLIGRARASVAEARAILEDARAIGHRLEAHEAAEDDMLLDTVDTDLGAAE
jgi:hypothetical protein